MNLVFIVHYYPPINSSGAKRVEALSKYLVAKGHRVTVITTRKTLSDGEFTESVPIGVELVELDCLGRISASSAVGAKFESMYEGAPSWRRKVKDGVMRWFGQIPDPRLPFSFAFLSPLLAESAKSALRTADVVVGSTPPWPMLLAALFAKWRFGVKCILDYRDQFSECHEMPGGVFAKWMERIIDRFLVSNADFLVTISEPMASYYRSMTPRVGVILNGYDPEVLENARQNATPYKSDRVLIRYMGIVSPGRVPHNFLRALVKLEQQRQSEFDRLLIEFYGDAALVQKALQEQYPTVARVFQFHSQVPYMASLQRILEADYLLFCETSSKATLSSQGILTTKLFEYIGSGRPILADISSGTLAGRLLIDCKTHHVVADEDDVFLCYMNQNEFFARRPDEFSNITESLSRKTQANQYESLIGQLIQDRFETK
jgi:glycosyltransferase involved in cell wall biosynthesis